MPVDLMQENQEQEVWKQVKGYEGLYFVSNKGRIKKETILKNVDDKYGRGYFIVTLCKNNIKKTRRVHQLVAEAFIGERPLKKYVNHKDTNKHNNNANNFEYLTPKENDHHAMRMGVKPKGEKCWNCKLTQAQVDKIREMRETGLYRRKYLAELFQVTESTIKAIINGRNWKGKDGRKIIATPRRYGTRESIC